VRNEVSYCTILQGFNFSRKRGLPFPAYNAKQDLSFTVPHEFPTFRAKRDPTFF